MLSSTGVFIALAAAASVSAQFYSGDGPYTGDGTYFTPGLGACGITNTAADMIAAVGWQFFDNYPGATANPNDNPLCGTTITATYDGVPVTVQITDRCGGCAGAWDLDFSPAAMVVIVPDYVDVGRVHGVSWVIDGGNVPPPPTTTTSSTSTTTVSSTSTSAITTTSTGSSGGGNCAGVAAWSSSVVYVAPQQVTYNGDLWTAVEWNDDEVPGGASGAWTNDGPCSSIDGAAAPTAHIGSRFFKA